MATKVNTHVIAQFLRDKIWVGFGSSPSLISCSVGDLERQFYPRSQGTDDYGTRVPCVFVQSQEADYSLATLNQRYHQPNFFRILYVDRIVEAATPDVNRFRADKIADLVLEDYRLATITGLSQAQVKVSYLRKIEYRPVEDMYVFAVNAQLLAVAITVEVQLIAWNL